MTRKGAMRVEATSYNSKWFSITETQKCGSICAQSYLRLRCGASTFHTSIETQQAHSERGKAAHPSSFFQHDRALPLDSSLNFFRCPCKQPWKFYLQPRSVIENLNRSDRDLPQSGDPER
jgi:hypothetical protein